MSRTLNPSRCPTKSQGLYLLSTCPSICWLVYLSFTYIVNFYLSSVHLSVICLPIAPSIPDPSMSPAVDLFLRLAGTRVVLSELLN